MSKESQLLRQQLEELGISPNEYAKEFYPDFKNDPDAFKNQTQPSIFIDAIKSYKADADDMCD